MFNIEPLDAIDLSDIPKEWEDIDGDVVLAEQVTPEPVRHTARDYVNLMTLDGNRMERIMKMLLSRTGITKAEMARRMGVNRASLQPYYRGDRKNVVSVPFLVKMLKATGARLLLELPPKNR